MASISSIKIMQGADCCACCGTHVRTTGQVGLVKLLSCQPFREGGRSEMVCGRRALGEWAATRAQNLQVSRPPPAQGTETAAPGGGRPGGRGGGRHPRRQWMAGALTALILLGCTSYDEAYRRFIHDELDASRLAHRARFETDYGAFLEALEAVPYRERGARVLLALTQAEMNPVVVNAASPVSFAYTYLNQGGQADYDTLSAALRDNHCGYLYLMECDQSLLELLPSGTRLGQLYRVEAAGGEIALTPWG